MIVLGLDTATRTASVGVLDGDRQLSELSQAVRGSLAPSVLPMVDEALQTAGCAIGDIELIAVSVGPGSFTGLRVGLSIAKGFAISMGCPVVGVSTLEALAFVAGPREGAICPILDARKGEVYGAAFRHAGGNLVRLVDDRAAAPEGLAAAVGTAGVLLGDGVEPYRALWVEKFGGQVEILPFAEYHPRGLAVAVCGRRLYERSGREDVAALAPRYCRASEAEIKRQS